MKDSRSTPPRQQKQPQPQQQQPSQKRALPPRHSFLTEAVQTALERQSTKYEPHIDANTILCISSNDNDDSFDQIEQVQDNSNIDQQVPELYQEPTVKPVFTVSDKPPRRPRKRSQPNVPINEVELIPEEYYLKRHRKHEKEEKKQKNREKERLQHEMYQQQQFVERVRHTDKSIIMAIASAVKQQQEAENTAASADDNSAEADATTSSSSSTTTITTTEPTPSSSFSTLPDVDVLYRQVLHDAEEHLRRYEMLGLTRKSRKEEHKSPPVVSEVSPPTPASPPASPPAQTHQQPATSSTTTITSTPATASTPTLTSGITTTTTTNNGTASSSTKHTSPIASSSSTTTTTTTTTLASASASNKTSKKKASTTIPPSFKSFFKSATLNEPPKGSRRSARNILAFGHRIPPMGECDFHLPMDEYGERMEERAKAKWKRHKKQ